MSTLFFYCVWPSIDLIVDLIVGLIGASYPGPPAPRPPFDGMWRKVGSLTRNRSQFQFYGRVAISRWFLRNLIGDNDFRDVFSHSVHGIFVQFLGWCRYFLLGWKRRMLGVFFKFFVYIPGLDCYYSVSMATNGRRMTGFSYGRVTISPFFFTMANSMEESLFHDGSFVI